MTPREIAAEAVRRLVEKFGFLIHETEGGWWCRDVGIYPHGAEVVVDGTIWALRQGRRNGFHRFSGPDLRISDVCDAFVYELAAHDSEDPP